MTPMGHRIELAAPGALTRARLHLTRAEQDGPGAGGLLIKVAACAVCRTDLQLVVGDLRGPGGCRSCRATRPSAASSPSARASRMDHRGACRRALGGRHRRHLPACRTGRENLCPAARFTGWDRDGGFAEYAHRGGRSRLPAALVFDDVEAAPLLCGGVIGYRALKVCGIEPGGRLGLFGFGASARLAHPGGPPLGLRGLGLHPLAQPSGACAGAGCRVGRRLQRQPPAPLDARGNLRAGRQVVVAALGALARGARWPSTPSTSTRCRPSPTTCCGGSAVVRSVANFTRHDARGSSWTWPSGSPSRPTRSRSPSPMRSWP